MMIIMAIVIIDDDAENNNHMTIEDIFSTKVIFLYLTGSCGRVLARERWPAFENSWKKNPTIFNEHPVTVLTCA